MKRTTILWTLAIVTAMSLLGVAATYAQGSQASLIVINYVGSAMDFTLDGAQYTVPGSDTVPQGGQMTFTLSSGRHDYGGVIPGGPGANGQVELAAGQTFVLGARLDKTAPRLSPDGDVVEEPRDVLILFEASQNPPAPAPTSTHVPLQKLPADQGALVFDNYIGEELVVDLQGTTYRVPADGRLQVNLAPGEYGYSVGAGVSGANGSAHVVAGQYTGLGFSREVPVTPTYDVGDPEPTPVILHIIVTPVDLSGEQVAG
jgi:hypothetical protein